MLERHGRWLHLNEAKLDKAERWFERWEDWAVFGRITPVVRSFVSIPAGVFHVPLLRYTLLTLAGSAIWCFGLAGVGWALGSQWEEFHHAFHYVDYAIIATLVAGAAWLAWKFCGGAERPLRTLARLLRREDRPRRRQGAVRAARAGVPRRLRARAPVGPLHLGPEVTAFEEEAAAFLGVPHAIGVANGTRSCSRSRRWGSAHGWWVARPTR